MDLIRDCLDKQVVDRNGRRMGRVSGINMEIRSGRQPRMHSIEIGCVTSAERLGPRIRDAVLRFLKIIRAPQIEPYQIPWAKVIPAGTEVVTSVNADETPALAWEFWLRKQVIGRIPGA